MPSFQPFTISWMFLVPRGFLPCQPVMEMLNLLASNVGTVEVNVSALRFLSPYLAFLLRVLRFCDVRLVTGAVSADGGAGGARIESSESLMRLR